MKNIFQTARVIGISILVMAWGLWAAKSYAGSNITTNGGVVLRWPSIPQVRFVINPGGVPGWGLGGGVGWWGLGGLFV